MRGGTAGAPDDGGPQTLPGGDEELAHGFAPAAPSARSTSTPSTSVTAA